MKERLMKKFVTQEFRDFVYAKYPELESKLAYRKLFRYICFGTWLDKQTGKLIVPAEFLFKMIPQNSGKDYNVRFKAIEFLEAFRKDVLPNMKWSEHEQFTANSWGGKARTIIETGFDAEMEQMLAKELCNTESNVNFITGLKRTAVNVADEQQMQLNEYEEMKLSFNLNPTQQLILNYLETVDSNRFIRKYHDNQKAVWDAIEAIDERDKKISNIRKIHSIIDDGTIYYAPSKNGRTCRLSPITESVPTLKSEVRKVFCKGWWEADLKSSQFAILAAKLNAPLSKAFIQSGNDLWQSFYLQTHGINEAPPKKLKAVYKELVYSICFGKSVVHHPSYKKMCEKRGMEPQEDIYTICKNNNILSFLDHTLIKELLTLRARWFDQIAKDGGAKDAWGTFIEVSKERPAHKVAASVIQSIEMAIIAPIFEVANKWEKVSKFKICFFQHDGVCISFNDKAKIGRIQELMQEAVKNRAKEFGVTTRLEFGEL